MRSSGNSSSSCSDASKRPRCTSADRALLVLLASRLRTWRHTLLIVQPETVLRWHRRLFRWHWRRKSQAPAPAHRPPLAPETIALIREMAMANPLWGAERIRGELLKVDIRVAKWTIQKYMHDARPPRRAGQSWAAFLRNHAHDVWACDFLPVTDLLFRPVYALFVIALGPRRVLHVGVTRHATDASVAQQLRKATPCDQRPRLCWPKSPSMGPPAPVTAWDLRGGTDSLSRHRGPGTVGGWTFRPAQMLLGKPSCG